MLLALDVWQKIEKHDFLLNLIKIKKTYHYALLILYYENQQKTHVAMSRCIVLKTCKKSVNILLEKCKNEFRHFFLKFMVRSNTAGGQNRAHVKRGKQQMTKSFKYDGKIRHYWKCCSHAAWEADFFLILAGDFSVKVDFWNTSRARMLFFFIKNPCYFINTMNLRPHFLASQLRRVTKMKNHDFYIKNLQIR